MLEHTDEDLMNGFELAMDFRMALLGDVLDEVADEVLHIRFEHFELSKGEALELGLERSNGFDALFHRAPEGLHLVDDNLGEQRLLVAEMVIDRGFPQTGGVGDVLHRDVGEAAREEEGASFAEDPVAAVTRAIHRICD
jgi:hypothetical protein